MKLLYKYKSIFVNLFKRLNFETNDFTKLTNSLRSSQQQRMYSSQSYTHSLLAALNVTGM